MEASLEVAWKMWENRNEYLHDDLHPWQRKGENSTNITIQELYEDFQEGSYLDKDKKLFKAPITTRLQLSLRKKKEWLRSIFAAQIRKRKFERRRHRNRALSDIRQYFQPK